MISLASRPDPAKRLAAVERVTDWSVSILEASGDARFKDVDVSVSEVRCLEEGCPPLETAILVMPESDSDDEDGAAGPAPTMKVQKLLLDVVEADVRAAVGRLLRGEKDCNCGEAILAAMRAESTKPAKSEARQKEEEREKLMSKRLEETTREDVAKLVACMDNGMGMMMF